MAWPAWAEGEISAASVGEAEGGTTGGFGGGGALAAAVAWPAVEVVVLLPPDVLDDPTAPTDPTANASDNDLNCLLFTVSETPVSRENATNLLLLLTILTLLLRMCKFPTTRVKI